MSWKKTSDFSCAMFSRANRVKCLDPGKRLWQVQNSFCEDLRVELVLEMKRENVFKILSEFGTLPIKVVVSFNLTFFLTKSTLLMIKCQIDITNLCWSANITSFSDLIRCSFQNYFIKERWRSPCPFTMLFNTEHAHEFFNIVSL